MSRSDFGIPKLFKQLDALDKKLRNKVIKSALRDGAKLVAERIRETIPVESGSTRKSVKVRAGRSRKRGQVAVEVVVGAGEDDPYVGFGEFGRKGQAANPTIRNAADAKRGEVVDLIARSIEDALPKAT